MTPTIQHPRNHLSNTPISIIESDQPQTFPFKYLNRAYIAGWHKLQLSIWEAGNKIEAGLTSLACLNIVLLQNSQIHIGFVAERTETCYAELKYRRK